MQPSFSRRVSAVVLLTTFGCSTTHLPPPPAPRPHMPDLDAPPPVSEGGLATVVISTDVRARVERVIKNGTGRHDPSIETLLCDATPCTVTLPYGDHELDFVGTGRGDRHSRILVSVKRPAEVINHVLGETTHSPSQGLAAFFGVLGVLTLTVGIAVYVGEKKEGREPAPAAVPLMVGGGALTLGGIVIGALSPTTHHDGSTTQWTPAPEPTASARARTFGASLGFHF